MTTLKSPPRIPLVPPEYSVLAAPQGVTARASRCYRCGLYPHRTRIEGVVITVVGEWLWRLRALIEANLATDGVVVPEGNRKQIGTPT